MPPVPIAYRALFAVFDIFLPLYGIYNHLFDPSQILTMFTPTHKAPPTIDTQIIMDAFAGWFGLLVIVTLYLQTSRKTDIGLWRVWQAGITVVDIFQLMGFIRALKTEGRWESTKAWRGEDWGNVGGYIGLAVVRGLFALGVGVGKGGERVKRD